MKIKYQTGNVLTGELKDADVQWLIVYDEYDQPVAAMEQMTDGHIYVTTCADEKFRDVIRRYGVDKLPRTGVANGYA